MRRVFYKAMKAQRTCFSYFIKLLFSDLTEKDDIRSTYIVLFLS